MSYATVDDLIDRYGQVEIAQRTDRVAGTVVDAQVAGRALADAAAEIDAHLAVRYALPLPTVPLVLRRCACALARYHLWETLDNERVRRDAEDARRLLADLATGRVSLGLPAGLPEPERPQQQPAAARAGAPAVFDRAGTGGY